MLKHAIITVGIAAVLLTGVIPVSDGCALTAAPNHACCVEPEPESTSTCCSSSEAPKTGTGHREAICDCVHPTSTPVILMASLAPLGPDEAASKDLGTEIPFSGLSIPNRGRISEHRLRSHPPPPVYLLDCAYLI